MKMIEKGAIFFMIFSIYTFGELTPQKYWDLEIKIRTLTVEGMQKRLDCLNEDCNLDKQMFISNEYEKKIANLFRDYNTTPSKELIYENRNRKALQKYLQENENVLNRIENIKEQFENYSNQITAVMENKQ